MTCCKFDLFEVKFSFWMYLFAKETSTIQIYLLLMYYVKDFDTKLQNHYVQSLHGFPRAIKMIHIYDLFSCRMKTNIGYNNF